MRSSNDTRAPSRWVYERTVVPAAPDACVQALERWGTMCFADVARRAILCAEQGIARHEVMVDYIAALRGRLP